MKNSFMTYALKFGGSSLADASQFRKVSSIIKSHQGRVFVVASAPGKRSKEDTKVTDMLYACHALAAEKKDFGKQLDAIKKRFSDIASPDNFNMILLYLYSIFSCTVLSYLYIIYIKLIL